MPETKPLQMDFGFEAEGGPGMRCLYCGAPAEYLCDGILGFKAESRFQRIPALHTCDLPMCVQHTKLESTGFCCTRSGKGRGCFHTRQDHCGYHRRPLRDQDRRSYMTELEANAVREQIWAAEKLTVERVRREA